MEDMPIQPGICASRIRCYTEGTMQRPEKLRNGRPLRVGKGTIYKSASSWQLAKSTSRDDEQTSVNQRKLCKSCDHLQEHGTSLGKTFVSSANIALVIPEATRKMSLQLPVNVYHDQRNTSSMESSSASTSQSISSIPSSSSNIQDMKKSRDSCHQRDNKPKDTPYVEEVELPWEINEEFPHIPVLERIKEFERQTGALKSQTPSPGRWKRKSLARLKSPGSVHSSPALSRRNSVDEKVLERNSRNSSPAILHLHAEMLDFCFDQDSQNRNNGEIPHSKTSKPVSILSGEQETLSRSQEVQIDTLPSFSSPTSQPLNSKKAPPESSVANTSNAITYLLPQARDCHLTASLKKVCESENITNGALQAVIADVFHNAKSHSTIRQDTECIGAPKCSETQTANALASCPKLGSSDMPAGALVRTFQEESVFTSDYVLKLQREKLPHQVFIPEGTSTEKENQSCEKTSEKNQADSSDNCQPIKNIQAHIVESNDESSKHLTSEVHHESVIEDVLDTLCNKLDSVEHVTASADHYQSNDCSKNPEPIIDELLHTEASIDTDVYSQRCSQQLGESLLRVLETVSRRDNVSPGPPAEDSGPCLSDCYSSSSDEESLPHLNPAAAVNSSINFSDEFRTLGSAASSITSSLIRQPRNNITGSDSEPVHLKEDKEPFHTLTTEKLLLKEREGIKESQLLISEEHGSQLVSLSSEVEQTESLECSVELSAVVSNVSPGINGAESNGAAHYSSSNRSAFSMHSSALPEWLPDSNSQEAGKPNADQALWPSGEEDPVNRNQKQPALPLPLCIPPSLPSKGDFRGPTELKSQFQDLSCSVLKNKQALTSLRKENIPPQVLNQQEVEIKYLKSKPFRRSKQKKYVNPDKVSHLQYLILQSPLVLLDGEDSESDESDVELNEFGEVKQDYPLGRLPDYIVAQIFSNLSTRDLAALKCSCKDFKWLIEWFDIKGNDSQWAESLLYREDPCMQCGKIRDPRGDVSLCRWHPKIYYKNGEKGRHYWTCCFAREEDAPGCETSLHDNKWSGSHPRLCKVARSWRQYWRSYPMES